MSIFVFFNLVHIYKVLIGPRFWTCIRIDYKVNLGIYCIFDATNCVIQNVSCWFTKNRLGHIIRMGFGLSIGWSFSHDTW